MRLFLVVLVLIASLSSLAPWPRFSFSQRIFAASSSELFTASPFDQITSSGCYQHLFFQIMVCSYHLDIYCLSWSRMSLPPFCFSFTNNSSIHYLKYKYLLTLQGLGKALWGHHCEQDYHSVCPHEIYSLIGKTENEVIHSAVRIVQKRRFWHALSESEKDSWGRWNLI